jgi:hypothetical protein
VLNSEEPKEVHKSPVDAETQSEAALVEETLDSPPLVDQQSFAHGCHGVFSLAAGLSSALLRQILQGVVADEAAAVYDLLCPVRRMVTVR